MGSITKKKINGKNYYYYVESKRINGKPHFVNQKYLGTPDQLLKMALQRDMSLQDQVLYAHEIDFGSVALMYDLVKRLGITEIIDTVVPKRKQGASIGTYIIVAALNRIVSPMSKSGLKDWYEKTCLPLITGLRPSIFSVQNFWNNVHISTDKLYEIENLITRKVIEHYNLKTDRLIYDATNFFTYIDTTTQSDLAKRGRDKAKRYDLRTVGLSLFVEPGFSVPLVSAVYPGNRNDSVQFSIMTELLRSRYESITGSNPDITFVFDRGNNSEDNLDLLEKEDVPFHYVGGLKKNQAPELFAVCKKDYIPLECPESASENLKKLTVHRMTVNVFGRDVTAVIVYNPDLEAGQMQGIKLNIDKTKTELLDLQERLLKWARKEIIRGKRPSVESVTKKVTGILKEREYMSDIFDYEIFKKDDNVFLSFSQSDAKLNSIKETWLGKTALFTDRDYFSNFEIVAAYRSAWRVESAFRQLKDTDFITVRPIFHWTDEKIAVHIFICVLAYRLCTLMQKELSDQGINCTIDQFIESMNAVKKVTTFYGDISKPKKLDAFIKGDDLANAIETRYKLQEKYGI